MAPTKRLHRTPEQLRAESKTLWYEYTQLCESADHLRSGTYIGDRTTLNNTVQGFATACRNISCFFFAHSPDFPGLQKDDLGAVDYVADWPTRCPPPSKVLRDAKEAANKQ